MRWFAFLLAVVFAVTARGAEYDYLDTALPIEKRVRDLVGRLTVDEKAELMRNGSIGVPRLGIPKYDWWNEALHGVARAGEATVFPQAIGLAAMWDDAFMQTVADTISTEARAKFQDAVGQGIHERYYGLTFWSPNINIFRDPRWGRGQETYGEDPFLTSRMGVAFVRGMQGPDTDHLKTAACAKHFAVHSGPEPTRYTMNVEPDPRDLHETYLPAFEALVREGHVESVMTAYSAIDGVPCTINPMLYGLLRQWGFDGHVVSDCGAVYTLFEKYHLARDFPEAEAMAVKAGLNLRCGTGEPQLGEAVRRGLLTMEQLDAGVTPLLRTLFRLGFFDPPEHGPFAKITMAENDSPAHAAIALEAARKSLVLLKNDGALPFSAEKLKRLAVIGPNADSVPALLGNYHGIPKAPVTALAGLRAALGERVQVDYARGCDYAATKTGTVTVPRTALHFGDYRTGEDGDYTGLFGEYFANAKLEGTAKRVQRDHQVDFQWTETALPSDLPATFSVRWRGTIAPVLRGEYHLIVRARGGFRLYLGAELAIDAWSSGEKTAEITRTFTGEAEVPLRLEYFADVGASGISLQWIAPPADAGFAAALEKAREADAIVFVGGLYAQLEGEDMRVDYEGFAGGDRTQIELPEIQRRLFLQLAALKKPIVFVNLSGGAVAFPEVDARANGVVQAWYPGQSGGTAIADVLLGKTNPAGRLPVTFYRATSDLPPFEDYRMAQRTYRYFSGKPFYPFGHGLSYTRFVYSNVHVSPGGDRALRVSVDVANVGSQEGDDVVQLYLQEPVDANAREKESLAGFRRVHLAAGEKQTVTFSLSREAFHRWNTVDNRFAVTSGKWQICVGASSSDLRATSEAEID